MAHDPVINSVVQTRAFTVIDAFFNTVPCERLKNHAGSTAALS